MRRARGQATVELALGSIVYVTVLVVGIHFAEAAWLSLKVQEAQTWALWESSHRRVQERLETGLPDVGPFQQTLSGPSSIAAQANRRYRDFSGRAEQAPTAGTALAMTRGQGLEVTCSEDTALENLLAVAPSSKTIGVLPKEGGVRCRAQASVQAINMPRRFLQADDGTFFQARTFRMEPMKVCGVGLPQDGVCGQVSLLTNDWALVGVKETGSCTLRQCENRPYRAAAEKVFDQVKGWPRGVGLANRYAGDPGAFADEYFFSYPGVERRHTESIVGEGGPGGGLQSTDFNTGGPGFGMLSGHSTAPYRCFLGRQGPGCRTPPRSW